MLTQAFLMLEVAKEHHVWPDDAMMVVHSQAPWTTLNFSAF